MERALAGLKKYLIFSYLWQFPLADIDKVVTSNIWFFFVHVWSGRMQQCLLESAYGRNSKKWVMLLGLERKTSLRKLVQINLLVTVNKQGFSPTSGSLAESYSWSSSSTDQPLAVDGLISKEEVNGAGSVKNRKALPKISPGRKQDQHKQH